MGAVEKRSGRGAVGLAGTPRIVALPLLVALFAACPGVAERPPPPGPPAGVAPPEIPNVATLDRDGDRIDDAIQAALGGGGEVAVEAVFDAAIGDRETEAFVREGGVLRHVFRAISHGFTGRIRRDRIRRAAAALGPRLLLLKGDRSVERHLDEATRTGRVRAVWADGFAGTSGLSGAGVTIAFLDSGVDGSHPDLAGRRVGWKDYTPDALTEPVDIEGHGTHVAGIALGSGAAFGVGPGTLRYTDSGDLLSSFAGGYDPAPIHLAEAFDLTSTATWEGSGTTSLALRSGADASLVYGMVSTTPLGSSPLTLSFSSAEPATANRKFTTALAQNEGNGIRAYAIANRVTNYPAVGDGFPALRGVASSARWFGGRIFPTDGSGTTAYIAEAMDDLLVRNSDLQIKVVNMSFGVDGSGDDPTLRAKVNTLVDNGLVVVCSGGNGGMSAQTVDPGRSAKAITVGATSDTNQVTVYTSAGFPGAGASDTDDKLDVVAPGGSSYESMILSVDSNSADGDSATFADVQADDYTSIMGTSMAAPFVAGSAALVIEALGRSGTPWTFGSPSSPLLVKMLLLASATETNAPREGGRGGDPILGRAASPNDPNEGYGIVNPDAATEAAMLSWNGDPVSDGTTGATSDRRAWGRKVVIPAGKTLAVSLTLAAGADYDLYVDDASPGPKGAPQLLAASVHPTPGTSEKLAVAAGATDRTVYVFVKRVSGSGSFTLTGTSYVCGNGVLDPGKDCDPARADGGVTPGGGCCSSTCLRVEEGAACDDGDACTRGEVCTAGSCRGTDRIVCAPSDACHDEGTCDPATGLCSPGAKVDGGSCDDGPPSDGTSSSPAREPPAPASNASAPAAADGGAAPAREVFALAGGGGCRTAARGSAMPARMPVPILLVLAAAAAIARRRSKKARGTGSYWWNFTPWRRTRSRDAGTVRIPKD